MLHWQKNRNIFPDKIKHFKFLVEMDYVCQLRWLQEMLSDDSTNNCRMICTARGAERVFDPTYWKVQTQTSEAS